MKPKSHTLFHFTKSKETLKLIFKNGFWPRYCLEDMGWIGQVSANFIAFPVVCFCDIPLSRISEHVGFYGEFGLGMTREWATANGLNPILYVASDNNLSSEFRLLNEHANKLGKDRQEDAKRTMRYLYAHIKPSDGTMIIDGKPVEKEFYQESEWRFVPRHENLQAYLTQKSFNNLEKINAANDNSQKFCSLKFTPKDVKYIFVKNDSDIPDLINFIQTELDYFPNADLKVLMSRVTSLESVKLDY